MDLLGAIIFILCSFLTISYAFFKYSYGYWKSRGIPHDEPSIPFGNVKEWGKVRHSCLYIKDIYDKYKTSGAKICGVYFLARPVAIVLDLDLVKHVLVKDFASFNDRGLCLQNTFKEINFNDIVTNKIIAAHWMLVFECKLNVAVKKFKLQKANNFVL